MVLDPIYNQHRQNPLSDRAHETEKSAGGSVEFGFLHGYSTTQKGRPSRGGLWQGFNFQILGMKKPADAAGGRSVEC
jgi:hypothetical protein